MMLFVAALVGANTVISRYLNALYARHNSLPMGTLLNYLTGLGTSLLALAALGAPADAQPLGVLTFRSVSMFLGGAVGVVLIRLTIYLTPRLSAFQATLLIFLGQLGGGLMLDYLLTGVFSPGKLLGGALVLLGLAQYARTNARPAETPRS
ncbi:MAG: EamA-like transporter family protein [Clostridiales bacterium]|nr:EamA-like transporter family protein [Clostridiales bacterium]